MRTPLAEDAGTTPPRRRDILGRVWLARQLAAVRSAAEPLVLIGGEGAGVPFVVDALRTRERVAWFELPRSAAGDVVAQGNALARAVNRVLAAPLLPLALPYRAQVQSLVRHRGDVLPLWLAVRCDGGDHGLLDDLLDLHHHGYRVLLDVDRAEAAPAAWRGRCRVLDGAALRVRCEEARDALPAGLDDGTVERLVRESDAGFGALLASAQRAAGLPRLLVPGPDGVSVDERAAEVVEPALAVLALRREGDVLGALELAVLRAPHLVEDLLRLAGPRYQEEGLFERLHLLLSAVPDPYARRERVLEWRLVAAFAMNDMSAVAADVDAHLQAHAAPALRARRAGTVAHARGFSLAEAAYRASRTPLTLWQYGRLHPNPDTALELLRESVSVAEYAGTRYDVARNAATLASKLNHLGQFARAAAWGRWALDVFEQDQLLDGPRRLAVINELAVARILGGDLAGLRPLLEDALAAVEGSLPAVATRLRSTVAYLAFAEGRAQAALELLEVTYRTSPRRTRGRYAYQLVRALHELGRSDEAAVIADDAVEFGAGSETHERLEGRLARGIDRACRAAALGSSAESELARGAMDDLLEVLLERQSVMEQRLSAALYYLLASGGAAHNLPADVAAVLRTLPPAALRVLSGPAERFEGVWATLAGTAVVLEFVFLGATRCRLDGAPVRLTPRLAEAALALALHPDGITRERLNDFLTPYGKAPFSAGGLRGTLTRLRALLPVSDVPYRFTVPFRADVLEARAKLASGRVREAITLLRGRLIPDSESPGVEEERLALEEELRQAALQSGDPEALFDLAERLGDDLQCWEATLSALSPGDPRTALARARAQRVASQYGLDAAEATQSGMK